MNHFFSLLLFAASWTVGLEVALAAPDEETLCKSRGYPVGTARNWFFDECVRVGSFTHHAEIPGIFGGWVNTMQPAATPLALEKADKEPGYKWAVAGQSGLSMEDYLQRQRVMALLVIKDGVIQFERYQYDRKETDRYLSNSMAKTITAMGVGIALREGLIRSLDDRADTYAPSLTGTLYGETTIRHLLRMSSGAKFEELYNGADDLARYGAASYREGAAGGAKVINQRLNPQGSVFNYASAETDMLALVMRGYGYQVWTFPGAQRRFALLGVYGQSIFVDPAQKLVLVHLAANATAKAGQTSMGRELGALWYGLVSHYGAW